MSRGAFLAMKAFDENLQQFVNPQKDPVAFNLYTGLAGIAEAIAQLDLKMNALSNQMEVLSNELVRIRNQPLR